MMLRILTFQQEAEVLRREAERKAKESQPISEEARQRAYGYIKRSKSFKEWKREQDEKRLYRREVIFA